ncbi:MAG TPA: exodeoxyribonuclease VII large subunit, partial [Phycisphaerales bacterium]|nr:exodeoxyribonuclease VII large subunit [Phycisphaerales bacterium]
MDPTRTILSVTQVNAMVKAVVEEGLPSTLVVRGQISGWKRHGSGHCYFSLKDAHAVLDCMMWSSKYRAVRFRVEDGMAVLATGHVDVYAARGRYQLYVDKLEPEGVGALQLAFEQMVRKLRAEGLFDEEHKKPLPAYPMRIGIVTSGSGAAVHDIRDSIWSRWPCVRLFLYPVAVQGEGAAAEIAAAIADVNRRNAELKLDVLIVGRGGGSLEDLWAFNEEAVARAIYASKIPVISAVGHEVDTTVADLVADARASTPTKAGVTAVPDKVEVLGRLGYFWRRLEAMARGRLELAGQRLERVLASWVFREPLSLAAEAAQRLDTLESDLVDAMRRRMAGLQRRLVDSYEQVGRLEPHRLIGRRTVELNELAGRSRAAVLAGLRRREAGLAAVEGRLRPAIAAV